MTQGHLQNTYYESWIDNNPLRRFILDEDTNEFKVLFGNAWYSANSIDWEFVEVEQ